MLAECFSMIVAVSNATMCALLAFDIGGATYLTCQQTIPKQKLVGLMGMIATCLWCSCMLCCQHAVLVDTRILVDECRHCQKGAGTEGTKLQEAQPKRKHATGACQASAWRVTAPQQACSL